VDDTLVVRLMLTAGLSVAVIGAVAAVLIHILSRRTRRLRKHRVPQSPSDWSGLAVVGAFFLFVVFNVFAGYLQEALTSVGFFRSLYGPDFPANLSVDPTPAERAAATVRYLWAHALAFPFLVVAMFAIPRLLKIANPFHGRRWSSSVVAGYLTWLIITPAAFCVFVVASITHMKLTGRAPEKHPLTALGELAGQREWGLFVLQTVLIAPILEEWLFRGVLLSWLAQKHPVHPVSASPYTVMPAARPLLVLVMAIGVAIALTLGSDALAHPDEVRRALADPAAAAASYFIPAGFFLALLPLLYIVPRWLWLRRRLRIRSPQQVQAIIASAALFAAFHAHVWPSPIPLLVLAFGLGYLYLRTRNLVAPIVVHGLFNAVSAVYLLLGGPA
jgi:membrane protease YdiL (CAAX protease family)